MNSNPLENKTRIGTPRFISRTVQISKDLDIIADEEAFKICRGYQVFELNELEAIHLRNLISSWANAKRTRDKRKTRNT